MSPIYLDDVIARSLVGGRERKGEERRQGEREGERGIKRKLERDRERDGGIEREQGAPMHNVGNPWCDAMAFG